MIPRLKLVNVTKRYGSTVANDAISLEVMPGEILSVLGENGAGKSTLMKIIFGSVTPDEGEIYFDGRKVNISSPADARELGIAMVFQHFVLFETLTAKENILLGMPEEVFFWILHNLWKLQFLIIYDCCNPPNTHYC